MFLKVLKSILPIYEKQDIEKVLDEYLIAKEENPNLILLDLMIPGLDGYDVCKAIRNDINTRDISIIMLTAKGEELDKVLGLELGADDYILKPFNPDVLNSKVKRLIKNRMDLKQTYMKLMMEK